MTEYSFTLKALFLKLKQPTLDRWVELVAYFSMTMHWVLVASERKTCI